MVLVGIALATLLVVVAAFMVSPMTGGEVVGALVIMVALGRLFAWALTRARLGTAFAAVLGHIAAWFVAAVLAAEASTTDPERSAIEYAIGALFAATWMVAYDRRVTRRNTSRP